jgi:hypothetical protein
MLENTNLLNMVYTLEPILWFVVFYGYTRSTVESRSRSFRIYLAVQMASAALLAPIALLMIGASGPAAFWLEMLHTQIFWWGSIAASLSAIGALRDMLAKILLPLVGLQRLALLSLQWLLAVAFLVILNRILANWGIVPYSGQLAVLAYGLTLAQMVVLLFVIPCTFLVRRSSRSRFQDVALGLAVLATSHVILDWGSWKSKPLSTAEIITQSLVVLTTLIFWILCFAGEEEVPEPRLLSLNSRLVRWSEKFRVLRRESGPAERNRRATDPYAK